LIMAIVKAHEVQSKARPRTGATAKSSRAKRAAKAK
jgi:hypothetical protein